MNKMYRQGDVLLQKVNELPNNAKLKKDDIILRGEATGHAHRIANGQIYETIQKEIFQPEIKTMYIVAKKSARIVHEEHAPIDIEIGIYIVIRQREFDDEATRLVMD